MVKVVLENCTMQYVEKNYKVIGRYKGKAGNLGRDHQGSPIE